MLVFLFLQEIIDPNMGNHLQRGAVGTAREDLLPIGIDHYCYLSCLTRCYGYDWYFCYRNQNFQMMEMLVVGFVPFDHVCLLIVRLMCSFLHCFHAVCLPYIEETQINHCKNNNYF